MIYFPYAWWYICLADIMFHHLLQASPTFSFYVSFLWPSHTVSVSFRFICRFFFSGKRSIQKIIWLEHWWVERGTNPSSAKHFVSQEQEHPQPVKHPVTLSNASSNTPCQVKHPEKHQHDTLRPAKYPKLETGNPPDRPEIGQTHCLDKPNRPNSKYTMTSWLEL